MNAIMKTRPAKRTGVLAVLTALLFISAGARAGSMETEWVEAGFTGQLAELTRTLEASAAGTRNKYLNVNELSDLLQDADPAVRKAAVRGSRELIANRRIYERVIFIMEDAGEPADLRAEAARALSYATQYNVVQEALARTIEYGSAPQALRVMAYKALWSAANGQPRTQEFLVDAVRYNEKDPAARRAAVWALFDGTRNNRPRECLTELLRYGKEDEATKIEMIKSLYNAMGRNEVNELIMSLAENAAEAKPVRLAALLSLSAATGDSRVRYFLERMRLYETDPELRAAVVEASSPSPEKILEYFHLSYRIEYGRFVNPIERE